MSLGLLSSHERDHSVLFHTRVQQTNYEERDFEIGITNRRRGPTSDSTCQTDRERKHENMKPVSYTEGSALGIL